MLTTQLRQIKSYPTYQLHAYTRSSSSAAEDMFRICILETMKWLRSRLSRFRHPARTDNASRTGKL